MDDTIWKYMFYSLWEREGTRFIQFLLDTGLDVNALNKFGKTMLSYAAECGNLQIAEFLVQNGADSNFANSEGSKPIHIATQYGRKDIVKFFLNRGISVDSCDEDKCTPLHYLAAKRDISSADRENNQELVHILVNRNADIDALDRLGRSPLILAAQSSRKHMVELFVRLGANLESCTELQWTVLHYACVKGWSGIVQTLVEGRFEINLDARTLSGSTPVILAAESSHEAIVKLLVEFGADVKSKDCIEETLLHVVCREGWLEVVRSIVSKGCDLNAKSKTGVTPLMRAAVCKHLSVVEHLIECGADVECCDEHGHTALHYACTIGSLEGVKSLLKKGSHINAQSVKRDTPLHVAIRHNNIVKHLLIAGADCNVVNIRGDTAFNMFATYECSLEIMISFLRSGAYFQTGGYAAISNNNLLREGILQNAQLCTVALMNKFLNADLPKMYDIPSVSGRLPRIEKMKSTCQSMEQDIAECVKYEIQTKGYCNVLNVRPIVLRRLCVLTLVKHYNSSTISKHYLISMNLLNSFFHQT